MIFLLGVITGAILRPFLEIAATQIVIMIEGIYGR